MKSPQRSYLDPEPVAKFDTLRFHQKIAYLFKTRGHWIVISCGAGLLTMAYLGLNPVSFFIGDAVTLFLLFLVLPRIDKIPGESEY